MDDHVFQMTESVQWGVDWEGWTQIGATYDDGDWIGRSWDTKNGNPMNEEDAREYALMIMSRGACRNVRLYSQDRLVVVANYRTHQI